MNKSEFSQFLTLLKFFLKGNFNFNYLKQAYLTNKKKMWEPILLIVVMLPTAGALIWAYVMMLLSTFNVLMPLGQGNVIITFGFAIASVVVLFFGILWIISSFYFSKDIEKLIPLPATPRALMMAKLVAIILNEYATLLLILVPPILIFGIKTGAGVPYYLLALLVFLLSPIIPLTIAAIISLLIMRFINLRKMRNLFTFLGVTLFLGVYFWFQYTVAKIPQNADTNALVTMLLTAQNGMVTMISKVFPPSLWATLALTGKFFTGGLVNLLKFVALSLLMLAVAAETGKRLFYTGLLAGQQVLTGTKSLKMAKGNLLTPQRSAVNAICARDGKVFFRNTVFILNGLIGAVLFPGLIIAYSSGMNLNGMEEIAGLNNILTSPAYSNYKILAVGAMVILMASMMMTSSTCFSREGSDFATSKTIPVSPRNMVMGKFKFSVLLCLIASIPMYLVLMFIASLNFKESILSGLLGIVGVVSSSAFSMIFDMRRPFLKWENPQRAVKNNINGVIGWLAYSTLLILLAFGTIFAVNKGLSSGLAYVIVTVILAVIGVISLMLLTNKAEPFMKRIEM